MAIKVLTEQQKECINLLVLGTMTKIQIADSIGVAEKTIYNWLNNNPVFKENLQKCTDIFAESKILDAKNKLATHLDMAIANIVEIAQDKSNSKSYEANKYLIDRNLGGISTRIEQTTDNKDINSNNVENIETMINDLDKAN